MPDFNKDITSAAKDLTNVAKDATYVAIGIGVLGFQKAQVQRQELLKRLNEPTFDIQGAYTSVRSEVADAVHAIDAKVEDLLEQVETAFVPLEDRLPGQAKDLAKQVHAGVKDARSQVRGAVLSAVDA